MRHYELMVVLNPVLSPEEFAGTLERIKGVITQSGGDITQEEQWGMRRLAYPIRRAGQTYLEGNYILTRFSTDTIVPRELEPHLTLSEDVLRFLVVRSEAPKPVPPQPEEPAMTQIEESGSDEPTAELADETGAAEPVVATDDEPVAENEAPAAAPAEELAAEEPASELADETGAAEPVVATDDEPVAENEAPAAALAEEPVADEPAAPEVTEYGEPQQEEAIMAQVEDAQNGEEAEGPQPSENSTPQSEQTRE